MQSKHCYNLLGKVRMAVFVLVCIFVAISVNGFKLKVLNSLNAHGTVKLGYEKKLRGISCMLRPDRHLLAMSSLDSIGNDISISPAVNGVTRIIMKFGGSSLATAERIQCTC